jgi:hypothetical protein
MMATDLTRFAALMTIPAAYALGWLSLGQLVAVSVVVAVAKIAFNAASGANLKALGGAAVGLLGPVTTALADAVSYLQPGHRRADRAVEPAGQPGRRPGRDRRRGRAAAGDPVAAPPAGVPAASLRGGRGCGTRDGRVERKEPADDATRRFQA